MDATNVAAATSSPGCPHQAAEQMLAAARRAGDRRREASALTDLAVMHLYEGGPRRAVALLEDAWAMTRQLGDAAAESDVLGNVGLATAAVGQPERALALVERSLGLARCAGDCLAEKAALDRLGLTHSRLRNPGCALNFFTQALALAREVGDWQHEVELLWYVAIQHAALGQRDEAVAQAQAAIDLLQKRGKPQAAWFAHHLHAYRTGKTDVGLCEAGPAGPPETFLAGEIVPSPWETQLGSPPARQAVANGPRLLDMAFSAARSMAQFLGSGWKTTAPEARQERQRACAACEYHTGLRCRLCGCFTGLKAALAHEECPIGRWPT